MSADETKKTPDVEAAEPTKDEAARGRSGRAEEGGRREEAGRPEAGREEARGQGREAGEGRSGRCRAGRRGDGQGREARAEEDGPQAGRQGCGQGREAREGRGRREAGRASAAAQGRRPEKAAKPAPKPAPELRHGKAGVATVVDADGKEVETRDLNKALFAVPADVNTLHLVVRAEQAARRRGTASTKTRGEVSGSTAKLYRQKGTGRARAGSVKSPIRTGGGVAFGPKPRTLRHQGQPQGRAQGPGHGAQQPRRERQRVRRRRPEDR